jgi:hypothetical protein
MVDVLFVILQTLNSTNVFILETRTVHGSHRPAKVLQSIKKRFLFACRHYMHGLLTSKNHYL